MAVGVVVARCQHQRLKLEAWGLIPGGCPVLFSLSANFSLFIDLDDVYECSSL